ncbi:acyltransferase [Flavobacteriales bacterium]|nr:acyltransferase [Flavobacteriales bacterium]
MYYTRKELKVIGFKSIGENVLISKKSSIYSAENIELGDNVRVDDFCVLSASKSLKIGSYVHIGCYSSIIGAGEVLIEDYCGISGKVSIYSSNDDYTGLSMTNPMVPEEYTKVSSGPVIIKKHSIIGCNCVILPNTILNQGVSVSSLSLLYGEYESFSVYSGVPAKKISNRQKRLLKYEKLLQNTK